jgi:hypothetical protein
VFRGVALQVLCCLLERKFKRKERCGLISLTREAAAFWGVLRSRQKLAGLDELTKRGILTYAQKKRRNPQVRFNERLLK